MVNVIKRVAIPKLSQVAALDRFRGLDPKWNGLRNQKNELVGLERDFKFKNFEDTWGFLNKVAMRSHLKGHHPTITTTYNKVKIELTTHDVGSVTDVDFDMAERFEDYAQAVQEKQ